MRLSFYVKRVMQFYMNELLHALLYAQLHCSKVVYLLVLHKILSAKYTKQVLSQLINHTDK